VHRHLQPEERHRRRPPARSKTWRARSRPWCRRSSIAGTRLDIDRLRETVALSRQCSDLWGEVLATAAHRPAPLTFFDGTIHMGPAVCLRGTPQALDYYRVLLAEMRQRIADGVAAVERERLRLYWEGMPVWGRLRQHSELFAEPAHGGGGLDLLQQLGLQGLRRADPFRSMARAYLSCSSCATRPTRSATCRTC
jgi:benzoyl-CoA reductase/2-hydroxyglutaryl-CoA dehydratase subunit BcrC/BadD/HgdB